MNIPMSEFCWMIWRFFGGKFRCDSAILFMHFFIIKTNTWSRFVRYTNIVTLKFYRTNKCTNNQTSRAETNSVQQQLHKPSPSKMNADQMLQKCGDFSYYQLLMLSLFGVINVLSSIHYYSQTIINFVPNHWWVKNFGILFYVQKWLCGRLCHMVDKIEAKTWKL